MRKTTSWVACPVIIVCLGFAPHAVPQATLSTIHPDAELEGDVDWCSVPYCRLTFVAFDGQTALVPFSEKAFPYDGRIGVNARDASGSWPLTAMVANPDHALEPANSFTPMPLTGPAAVQGDTMLVVGTSKIWRNRDVVYVMKRVAGQWSKQQVLAPQVGPGFTDARIMDVELDDGVALVSVIHERAEPGGSFVSHAQVDVYHRQADGFGWRAIIDPGSWSSLDRDTGYRVAIDGNLALIADPTALSWSGRAFIYERTTRGWLRRKTLEPQAASATGVLFGDTIDIAGNTAVVSAPLQQDDPGQPGAVYVYERSGSVWQQPQILAGTRPAGGSGSIRVNVSVAGDRLVIASDRFMVPDWPLAHLFERRGSAWTVVGRLDSDEWQTSANVSLAGSTVLLGAYIVTHTSPNTNLVYELPPVGTL